MADLPSPTRLSDVRRRLAVLLFAADAAFVGLHIAVSRGDVISNWRFAIDRDLGYAEVFQYIKEFWIGGLLALFFLTSRRIGYLLWAALFAYLLLDDAIEVHESLASAIVARFEFSAFGALRGQDFGELAVAAGVGVLAVAPVVAGWRSSSPVLRRFSRRLLLGLIGLAVAGVGMDLVHQSVVEHEWLSLGAVVLEDGGEMVVMSLILALVFGHEPGEAREAVAGAVERPRR